MYHGKDPRIAESAFYRIRLLSSDAQSQSRISFKDSKMKPTQRYDCYFCVTLSK